VTRPLRAERDERGGVPGDPPPARRRGPNATEGGLVTDLGSALSFSFHDPDGGWHEVMWTKAGVPLEEGIAPPGEWNMIELD
jgi:hypothetical protein